MMSEDFKIGDLVWAKMKGFPLWPARIVEPQPNSKPPLNSIKCHYVYLFGSDNFAWISIDCISPHSDSILNLYNRKKPGVYQNAIDALISHINENKKEKPSPPKFRKETDPKKPLTGVLNSVPKKRPHEDAHEDDMSSSERCQYKLQRARESFGKIERLLLASCELKEEKLMTSVEIKHVEPTVKKIGFIGLGNMGQAILRNLLKSGHKVSIWNGSQSKCDAFVKLGAIEVNHACDLIVECDITFCCVDDVQASKEIFFMNHGILDGLKQSQNSGRVAKGYVEMTSIDPDTSLTISEEVITKQGRYLEAPVCGTSKNAVDGSLLILASGDQKLFLDCVTYFWAMVKHAYFFSRNVGHGTKMCLLLSMLNGTVCASVAEAMALAESLNLPNDEFLNTLCNCPEHLSLNCQNILEKCRMMADPNSPTITPLNCIQNDLNLSVRMGDINSQPMPINAAANEVYRRGRLMKYSE